MYKLRRDCEVRENHVKMKEVEFVSTLVLNVDFAFSPRGSDIDTMCNRYNGDSFSACRVIECISSSCRR